MKKTALVSPLFFAAILFAQTRVYGEPLAPEALHVVKSSINAESDNAEFCLEFDRPLAPLSALRLASALKLESSGKKITPQHIEVARSSLCVFPLDRDQSYRVDVAGLRGEAESGSETKMAAPYSQTFTIPDRAPSLAFTGKNGGVNGFAAYDRPLTLRTVNVSRVKSTIYRITDLGALARAWQDRKQVTLAPSESVYLAKSKGQQIWQSDALLEHAVTAPNVTSELSISLRDQVPHLVPGLYLMIVDAALGDTSANETKGLAPLAATWFTQSDFSLRAMHDDAGIHVFASKETGAIHLSAMNKRQELAFEGANGANGVSFLPYPPKLADPSEIASVVGIDEAGNVAFADNEALPPLSNPAALGVIQREGLYVLPGEQVDVSLSDGTAKAPLSSLSVVRLSRADAVYSEFKVVPSSPAEAKLSFVAPAKQGEWKLRWQKTDGALLADYPFRVTANPDAPRVNVKAEKDFLSADGSVPISITVMTSSNKGLPLIGGHIKAVWQYLDPAVLGWKDYHFGMPTAILAAPVRIADFLSDLQGNAELKLTLPKPPAEPGLYQALVSVNADPDLGIEEAKPLLLPLRPDVTVVGVKPLAANARFAQNDIARFAIVGLASDGKPRDVLGLTYQIFEAGRSFAWYQDEGRWQYKPEPQLRPIGGGSLSVKADATSVLEWPVTAGNYQLEVLDPAGKKIAQTDFSAGWDSTAPAALPLSMTLPKKFQQGHDATISLFLPEPAMVTMVVADQQVRKIIHEIRSKGENIFVLTPAADWQNSVHIIAEAAPLNSNMTPLRALAEVTIATGVAETVSTASGTSIETLSPLLGIKIHKGETTTLTFGVQNFGDRSSNDKYLFTTSPGLKIDQGEKGSIVLGGRQSRSLSLSVSAEQLGLKEVHLDVSTPGGTHVAHSWSMNVTPAHETLQSQATSFSAAKELLFKGHLPDVPAAIVSRRSMDGLIEILEFVLNGEPFSTEELAFGIDTLDVWGGTLAQVGAAPEAVIATTRQQWMQRLLRHQNTDGGFPTLRGGESDMEITAAVLQALAHDATDTTAPAKLLAIAWLKQRLSNTWFDDKERDTRALAYASLAAAGASDGASLHYFSDTSATATLSPVAEASIAAAFKQMRDPNAAAFWIRKMLDEHSDVKSLALLDALSQTDALSSDDVGKALALMADDLRKGKDPTIDDAGRVLRAVAADNVDAGNWKLSLGSDTKTNTGAVVLKTSDAAILTARNADPTPLAITLVSVQPTPASPRSANGDMVRKIYRLNGGEVLAGTKMSSNESYLVELRGTLPTDYENAEIVLQDGGSAHIRPIGCPLPAKLRTASFLPWINFRDVTSVGSCELSPYALNAVLIPDEDSDGDAFRVLYFAHIDATDVASIPPPRLRLVK